MLNTYRLSIAILVLLPCLAWADTTITYQGQLRDASGPVNGTPGMEFRLFDSETGGSQVGSAIVLSAVSVTDGLFQIDLDFGDVYGADPLYLEVMVSGQTLAPRQRITSTPVALHALSVDTTFTDDLYWRQGGNAGTSPDSDFLGTTDAVPFELHVEGNRALRIEPVGGSPNIIGGWMGNEILDGAIGATIGGGGEDLGRNVISGTGNFATVSGGSLNTAGGENATIGGGIGNSALGAFSTVAGGFLNKTLGDGNGNSATIGGGANNQAKSSGATVAGGQWNAAEADNATIGGGIFNNASGDYSIVPGGSQNTAAGDYSFAAGRRAQADHNGTFVWADSTDADFATGGDDQFIIRASGGVGINTNNPWTPLHIISDVGQDPFRAMVGDNNVDSAAIRAYAHQGVSIGRSWGDTAVPARGLRVYGRLRIGQLGAGGSDVCITTDGTLSFCSSSARYKDNITPLESARELLRQLRAVEYEWIEDGRPDIGLIAEEVAEVIPEIVTHNREGEIQGIEYSRLSALLIAAFQEQEEESARRFAALEAESAGLEQRVSGLSEQNVHLQERLAALEALIPRDREVTDAGLSIPALGPKPE